MFDSTTGHKASWNLAHKSPKKYLTYLQETKEESIEPVDERHGCFLSLAKSLSELPVISRAHEERLVALLCIGVMTTARAMGPIDPKARARRKLLEGVVARRHNVMAVEAYQLSRDGFSGPETNEVVPNLEIRYAPREE